ncbi:LD-carboxypeptidase [Nonomuraea phyllanthi]|uniref:LD-carboxypeptidase n=1 Tax=Nonomuraea phyllanthi TaxID=2219224 RepID=A0A5C4WS30_9ACTN|nr:S66 peptidase family protein [Nonomuraea phyllanthi]KAB8196373.1 LD-carboxypeptidase [Nonomuraea phyllanthi]QFY05314.1 LD-carboxypeptidase [Nonomuraea phyllanthi]
MPAYPDKPKPGDKVAVLSPGAALPAIFPAPYELGLTRLREDFGLVPVEYPTTRELGASPAARAADVHAAFADPSIKAVLTSIGGDDQIKVLRHLDADLLRAHPKPFFGISDNTNLCNFLWNLGIVSYYGGTIMTLFGRGGAMHTQAAEAVRAALFTHDAYDLRPAEKYTDVERDWNDPASLEGEPDLLPGEGWQWHGPRRTVTGPSWGGCLEIVDWNLRVGTHIQDVAAYDGCVLFLETTEELPDAAYVYRVLMSMGERGLLQRFGAAIMARPKAWSLDSPLAPDRKAAYVAAQREAVLRAFEEYSPDVPVVLNVDIGHTDPQLVVPYGGTVTVDAVAGRITVTY